MGVDREDISAADEEVPAFVANTRVTRFEGHYSFLSNFHRTNLRYEGITYPSVENAYQAAKALSPTVRQRFSVLADPVLTSAKAKQAGKKLDLRPDWEQVKLGIMLDLVRIKFTSLPLQKMLLRTSESYLVEENWWGDKFWGVSARDGEGENHLGKILMQVRDELNNKSRR